VARDNYSYKKYQKEMPGKRRPRKETAETGEKSRGVYA
jgi:hypothetical protein